VAWAAQAENTENPAALGELRRPWFAADRAEIKSVRIASLFSLFSFAIFLDSTKRIFPDSGVP
jgi:hypothetical protein